MISSPLDFQPLTVSVTFCDCFFQPQLTQYEVRATNPSSQNSKGSEKECVRYLSPVLLNLVGFKRVKQKIQEKIHHESETHFSAGRIWSNQSSKERHPFFGSLMQGSEFGSRAASQPVKGRRRPVVLVVLSWLPGALSADSAPYRSVLPPSAFPEKDRII